MVEIEEMRRKFDNSPYAVWLGMRIEELSRGYAKVTLEVREEFLTWDHIPQGGVIASLLDQAFGCAVNTLENIYVAVQLSINYLSPAAVGETLHAEARVVHAGRTLAVSEMTVVNSKGKTIARATGTSVSVGTRT
jgi:phenylacetic acid degradation protein PaaD